MSLNLERVSPGDLITARFFNALLDTLDALDARLTQVEDRGGEPVTIEPIPVIKMDVPGQNTIAFPPPGDANGRAITADRTGTVNVKVETGQAGEYRYEASVDNPTSFNVRGVKPKGPQQGAPLFVQDLAIDVYATAGGWALAASGTLTVRAYRLRADGSISAVGVAQFPILNRGIVL